MPKSHMELLDCLKMAARLADANDKQGLGALLMMAHEEIALHRLADQFKKAKAQPSPEDAILHLQDRGLGYDEKSNSYTTRDKKLRFVVGEEWTPQLLQAVTDHQRLMRAIARDAAVLKDMERNCH